MLIVDEREPAQETEPGWLRKAADLAQIVKYAVIGLGAVAIDIGVFLVLDRQGMAPLLANSVSVGLAVLFSFVMNARFTFGVRDRIARRFGAFLVVNLIGFALGQLVIFGLTEPEVTAASVAKLISLPLVVGVQYLLNSNWTFVKDA